MNFREDIRKNSHQHKDAHYAVVATTGRQNIRKEWWNHKEKRCAPLCWDAGTLSTTGRRIQQAERHQHGTELSSIINQPDVMAIYRRLQPVTQNIYNAHSMPQNTLTKSRKRNTMFVFNSQKNEFNKRSRWKISKDLRRNNILLNNM